MSALPRLLIANRGEIAARIIRAARTLGLATVAIYSEADADSPYVALADEAVPIGPAASDQSYLSTERIIAAASLSGSTFIHPGYGFLSENAEFARACVAAGLTFVGPSPDVIASMGNKATAKKLAAAADVPCIPGYDGEEQSDARLAQEAERIGFPLMVKAAHGGGGRGLRLVTEPAELASALDRARSEAQSAFGSGRLILEKALAGARHVEVQVLADRHGLVLHLFERDCSLQRRYQKIVEEAPSPFVDARLRARLCDHAVALARGVDYVGAGTVEFLVADGQPFFLEMNTRLQVEHAVTEMITGLDLVEWQLRIALGQALPFTQDALAVRGHAIEARLYAEDPASGFVPQTGTILAWRPAERDGVRYEMDIASGTRISPHYDPMLGKIIAWGEDRAMALRRLTSALSASRLLGLRTNRGFLADLVTRSAFAEAGHDLATFGEFIAEAPGQEQPDGEERLAILAAALLHHRSTLPGQRPPISPRPSHYRIKARERTFAVSILESEAGLSAVTAHAEHALQLTVESGGTATAIIDGIRGPLAFAYGDEGQIALHYRGQDAVFADVSYIQEMGGSIAPDGRLTAAMEGVVVAVLCKPGEEVETGQCLIVMESMKMEHRIIARDDAIVDFVAVNVGDKVFPDQPLAYLGRV